METKNGLDLTQELRINLNQFKESELFNRYDSFRQDVRFIEIMINLSELAFENNRKIKIYERCWFDGSYVIDTSFTGKWSVISNLYTSIVELLKISSLIE
jgi:hypothetical protein